MTPTGLRARIFSMGITFATAAALAGCNAIGVPAPTLVRNELGLEYSTEAVTDFKLRVLVDAETDDEKRISAAGVKEVTHASRVGILVRERQEILDRVVEMPCDVRSTAPAYGCAADLTSLAVEGAPQGVPAATYTACALPKPSAKYLAESYLCQAGKRNFDLYRIATVCNDYRETPPTYTRESLEQDVTFAIDGPGIRLTDDGRDAVIKADEDVYFLSAMKSEDGFIEQMAQDLLGTAPTHPSIEGGQVVRYRLTVTSSLGTFENQQLGETLMADAESHCTGAGQRLVQQFGSALTEDLASLVKDGTISQTYDWYGLDARGVADSYIKKITDTTTNVMLEARDADTGAPLTRAQFVFSGLDNLVFDFPYFEKTFLADVQDTFLRDLYRKKSDVASFAKFVPTDSIPGGGSIRLRPGVQGSIGVSVIRSGYLPAIGTVAVTPATQRVIAYLVRQGDADAVGRISRLVIE